jgi:hypothetical protein
VAEEEKKSFPQKSVPAKKLLHFILPFYRRRHLAFKRWGPILQTRVSAPVL